MSSTSLLKITTPRRDNTHQNQRYGGGWSTSINAVFDDPSRHSNCCALLCCGVLLSDRTAYLLGDDSTRMSWINIVLPLMFLVAIGYLTSQIQTTDATNDDGEQQQQQQQEIDPSITLSICIFVFIIYTCFACFRGARKRAQARKNMVLYKKEQQQQQQQGDDAVTNYHVDFDWNRETRLFGNPTGCCGCYKNDDTLQELYPSSKPKDLSAWIFQTITDVFCCGKYWCQCCGMCAIGQEDRELQRIYKEENLLEKFQMDYITYQKYSEYYPAIQAVQNARLEDFKSHFQALSTLSKRIFTIYIFWEVVILLVLPFQQFLVRLGVISQAMIFLYFVYWKWNRFDISLDSIIKYFASGYIIGFFQALVAEYILVLLFLPISIFLFVWELQDEASTATNERKSFMQDNPKQYISDTFNDHWIINSIGLLLFTFIVAALVEELVKYYCYFILETPEQQQQQLNSTTEQQQSKTKQANYITIAMIAAALGFACKENMQYVLNASDAQDEIATLILRSLLPLHPLCAAIQSIGIVKRDVELNSTFQLGRSILPAILLHGTYDFTLLFCGMVIPASTDTTTEDDDDSTTTEQQEGSSIVSLLLPIVIGFFFMVSGTVYYCYHAQKQRKRLLEEEELEGENDKKSYSTFDHRLA